MSDCTVTSTFPFTFTLKLVFISSVYFTVILASPLATPVIFILSVIPSGCVTFSTVAILSLSENTSVISPVAFVPIVISVLIIFITPFVFAIGYFFPLICT